MANSPQARKRAKQNSVRRLRNHSQRSAVRTAIKHLEAAIVAGDEAKAKEAYQASASIICLLYTSPSPRDKRQSRMPSSA